MVEVDRAMTEDYGIDLLQVIENAGSNQGTPLGHPTQSTACGDISAARAHGHYGRLVVVAQEEQNAEMMLRDVAPSVTELAGDFRVYVQDFAGYT